MVPPGTQFINVTWTEITAIDNSGITPTLVQSHHSGDIFFVGTTNVTYTFADVQGNEATCSFTVTGISPSGVHTCCP